MRAAAAAAAPDIAALNNEFGIPDHVEVFAGLGGLPTVRLMHACGASAEVCLFGGCITSFKQVGRTSELNAMLSYTPTMHAII